MGHLSLAARGVTVGFGGRPVLSDAALDIPAGTAVRFEPGQTRDTTLIPYQGTRRVFGFRAEIQGDL